MKKEINIGVVQFSIDTADNTHLMHEYPLGSIGRMFAEVISEKLNFLGIKTSITKLIVTKPEENTYKQLIYTDLLPVGTIKNISIEENFDYCIYGKIIFDKGLKLEVHLFDIDDEKNIRRREFNSKDYNLGLLSSRIISEFSKIISLDIDLKKLSILDKYSTDNLKAWGWFGISYEEDIEIEDKETALAKTIEIDKNFANALLRLISIQLKHPNKRNDALIALESIYENVDLELFEYYIQVALNEENWSVSDTLLEYAYKKSNDKKDILLKAIRTQFELKKYTKLKDLIEKYLSFVEDKDINFENISYMLLVSGEKDKAIEICMKGTKIYPNNPKIYSILAFANLQLNKLENADKYYEKSISLQLSNGVLEDWTAVLVQLGKFQQIIDITEQYKQDLIFNSGIKTNIALAYINLDQKDKGLKILEKASKDDKNNPKLNFLMGTLYLEEKSYARAQKYLVLANKDDSNNPFILKVLGDLFFEINDNTEAQKYYEKALNINPNLKISRNTFIQGLNFNKEEKHQEALNKFFESIKEDPSFLEPLNEIGKLAFLFEDYDKSIDFFNKYISKNDKNPDVWLNLHKVYAEKGKGFFKKNWKVKAEEALNVYNNLIGTTNG
jgi:tetratricopeptide (TPR) repeat protein